MNSVIDTDNRLAGDGTYTCQYDKDGNRTRRTKASDASYTDYTYDQRQRLTSAVTKDVGGTVTRSVDYTYDAFDRLVKRVTDLDGAGVGPAVTEYFAYDGHDVALTFDASGNLTKRYLNGPAADQVLAEEQLSSGVTVTHADRTYWALSDYAGTVRDVYNSAGALKNHLTYDAFGNVKTETASSIDFLYGFQGLLRDEATGLYLSQTRWLDPLTGKWLQEDWISFAGGDANLARFVGNSPTLYSDSRGTDATSFVHWWNSWTAQPASAPPTSPGVLPPPPPETNPTRPSGPGRNPGEQPKGAPSGKTNPKGPAGGGRPSAPRPSAPTPKAPAPRPGPRVGTNPGAVIGAAGGILNGIGAQRLLQGEPCRPEELIVPWIEFEIKAGRIDPALKYRIFEEAMRQVESGEFKPTWKSRQECADMLKAWLQRIQAKVANSANADAKSGKSRESAKTSREPETAGAAGGQGDGGGGESVATGGRWGDDDDDDDDGNRGSANPEVQKAASRGSSLHADKPGNLPDQLRQRYPDTQFEFTKSGDKGQDVRVVGGKHPSDYPGSSWRKGVDHADFKPDTLGGAKTFRSDQRNKWAEDTQMLPYNPNTGTLQ